MTALPLSDRPLYELVAERLRAAILSHAMAPGSWIDEQALCSEYGISRTPLREALKVLATEGLVTMKPRRGAYVTEVPAADLDKLFHLLALLEGDAAAARFPKPLTDDAVRAADVVITMGCGDACPFFPGKRYEDWKLDDPAGQGIDAVRPIRDEIRTRIEQLVSELV